MSDTIIKVENLSKSYQISHQKAESYTALRDVITNSAKGLLKNATNIFKGQQLLGNNEIEEFYALKDVNFEIKRGDRVGIIGRNGAGKSTLLKILSRITEPTSGRITMNGRVASLLEVGTGFHPELTGRENIYLNGAILGMSRAEIKRKFDEIVDFAEVERFLDTPVKRYSSGMYVRLAFAVAAHLEPEILLVDEVLAVGDAEFQKKCLGKMEDVSNNEGRTILFVSHNIDALRSLCLNGILLEDGRVKLSAEIEKVAEEYIFVKSNCQIGFNSTSSKPYVSGIEVNQNELINGNLIIKIDIVSSLVLSQPKIGVQIKNKYGMPIYACNTQTHVLDNLTSFSSGTVVFKINNLPLHSDTYNLSVYLGDSFMNFDEKIDVLSFDFISKILVKNKQDITIVGSLNIKPEWEFLENF